MSSTTSLHDLGILFGLPDLDLFLILFGFSSQFCSNHYNGPMLMSVLEGLNNDLKCHFCHYIDDAAQIAVCLTVDPKRSCLPY